MVFNRKISALRSSVQKTGCPSALKKFDYFPIYLYPELLYQTVLCSFVVSVLNLAPALVRSGNDISKLLCCLRQSRSPFAIMFTFLSYRYFISSVSLIRSGISQRDCFKLKDLAVKLSSFYKDKTSFDRLGDNLFDSRR